MLTYGETQKRRKEWLLDLIRTNRSFIKELENKRDIFPEADELLPTLRQEIKDWLAEMVDLERWRRREGYDPEQPYKPPSLIAYEKQLEADGELEDYMEYNSALRAEIDKLEYEYQLKEGKDEN